MAIEHLMLQGLRNIDSLTLSPTSGVNIIYGENGSGKTSLLEAIYLLAYGRSFRTHKQKNLIQHEKDSLTVFGRMPGKQLGIERTVKGERRIKLNGEWLKSAAQLAELLPVQLLDPSIFRLLEGSPPLRRQFIDWGVFHVEQNFINDWRDMKKCLDTRNALLRQSSRKAVSEIEKEVWHSSLATLTNRITDQRRHYLSQLTPVFDEFMQRLNPELSVELRFYQGWAKDRDYMDVLNENWDTDAKQGFTQLGAQRADLKIKANGLPAIEVLSRGQQKIVVCALKLAQAACYQQHRKQPCIFLVDDLAAELDIPHRKALCGLLEELKCQVFVTAVEATQIAECWAENTQQKRFHVERGAFKAE